MMDWRSYPNFRVHAARFTVDAPVASAITIRASRWQDVRGRNHQSGDSDLILIAGAPRYTGPHSIRIVERENTSMRLSISQPSWRVVALIELRKVTSTSFECSAASARPLGGAPEPDLTPIEAKLR